MESKGQQLYDACRRGDLNSVKKLVGHRDICLTYKRPPHLETALHACARLSSNEKTREIAAILLRNNKEPALIENNIKWIPLIYAVIHGNMGFLEELFEFFRGPSRNQLLNWTTPRETKYMDKIYPGLSTALHIAVHSKNCEIIRTLLSINAHLLAEDENGKTAIEIAAEYSSSNPEVLRCFLQKSDCIHQLILESLLNVDIDKCLTILLGNGISVNAKSQYGYTPLYLATEGGKTSAVESLISKGADVNIHVNHTNYARRYENNLAPLHLAVVRPHLEIVKILLEAGANVNATDQINKTPLHYICDGSSLARSQKDRVKAHLKCCILLIQNGTRLNVLDSRNRSAYVILINSGYIFAFPIIFTLISAGMANVPSHNRSFPKVMQAKFETLLFSIEKGARLAVNFMLESGFKFEHLQKIKLNANKDILDEVINERLPTPLSLKRQCANVIRLGLHPNAWVGLKQLKMPPGFNKEYIVLNLSSLHVVDPLLPDDDSYLSF